MTPEANPSPLAATTAALRSLARRNRAQLSLGLTRGGAFLLGAALWLGLPAANQGGALRAGESDRAIPSLQADVVTEQPALKRILFVDSAVADSQEIVAAAAPGVSVLLLNPATNGFTQIADHVRDLHDLDSISIVSHGNQGVLALGNIALHTDDLPGYQAEAAAIGAALKPHGEILLYGCSVGGGAAGSAFVHDLAQATGAVVAASTNVTGNAAQGGDWNLELSTATISIPPALDVGQLTHYGHILPQPSYSSANGYVSETFFTLNFDLALDAAHPPATSSFDVQINGTGTTVISAEVDSAAKTVKLSFTASALTPGDIIEFTYTDPTAGNDVSAIQGLDGTDCSTFSHSIVVTGARPGPSSPPTPTLNPGTDSGTVGDGITNFTTPTVSGTADANNVIKLYDTGGTPLLGSTTADGSGNWSITSSPLTDGTHILQVAQTDSGSNTSPLSTGLTLKIDTSAAAPNTIGVAAGSDSGTPGDGISNAGTPAITGKAEAGATVRLYDTGGTTLLGTGTADGGGNWSITTSTLLEGSHTLTAKQTDLAGNLSAASGGFTYILDTLGPVGMALTPTSVNVTNATSGATISTISSTDLTSVTYDFMVGNGTIDADNGKFSISGFSLTAAQTLPGGTYHIYLSGTDAAGNVAYNFFTITVISDITPPTLTSVAIASNNPAPSRAKVGNTVTVTFTASEALLTPSATVAGHAATIVNTSGTTYTATTTMLAGDAEGAITFSIAYTDLAGNAGTAVTTTSNSSSVTFDRTVPLAPVFTAITNDTGSSSSDFITSDTTLILSGTAEANSTVTVSRIGSGVLGTATTNGSGAWSYDYTGTTLTSGSYSFTATATDSSGNVSSVSAPLVVTVDTTTPAPVITALSTDTGSSAIDGITSDTTLTLSGTGEANSTVTLTRSGIVGPIGTASVNGSGTWSFVYATTLVDGSYIFAATAVDLAGNSSAASPDFPVTIDTTVPLAPVFTAISTDTGSSATDQITNDQTLLLSGTAEAGSTVTISRTGTGVLGVATATGGTWTYDYTGTTLPEGIHTFTATATDPAGNVSPVSANFAVTVDVTAPVVTSAITASATYKSTVTYTVTASGSATSFGATGLPAGLSITAATGVITGAPTQSGSFQVALTATDAAGNIGSGSLALTVSPVVLTVAGITAANRTYDATTAATLTTSGANLVGVVGGDTVTLDTSAALGAFATKDIGTAKPVTISGLTIGGASVANYTLTQPTATANITAKALTVTGVTASSKTYNSSTAATLGLGSATLVGVISTVPPQAVTLVTSGATGAFSDANVGFNKTVTVSGLTLGGVDAANYSLTPPTAIANITAASVSIAITNLAFTYDGTPKTVTVSASPSVATSIVYSNTGGVAPTNAGSYLVSATVADNNYSGSASATLTIAKANQTVNFTVTGSNFAVGSTLGLNATASSGLPVTFSVVSGGATLSGSNAVITAAGPITLRASQSGDSNYNSATADQSFTGIAGTKSAQTISFTTPSDHTSADGSFALTATATSGLPVSFTILSGPALLVGNTVVLSGAPGVVTIRASQGGNTTFAAAPDVIRSFSVASSGPTVFFGDLVDDSTIFGTGARGELLQTTGPRLDAKTGDIAAVLYPGNRRGNLIVVSAALSLNVSLDFTLADDGSFTIPFTSAGRALTLTGKLTGTTLIGRIPLLKVSFTTQVLANVGLTSNLAGFYDGDALNTAQGGTASIVGPNGQLLIVATAGSLTTGALGSVGADGKFTVAAPGATITGSVDAPTTTVSGTIVVPGQSAVTFSGLAATTSRTDRLVNLSSRVRVGPTAGRTLITGFVIGGGTAKRVLLRATGPALTTFGVQGALSNPRLQLFDAAGKLLLENDDWSGTETAAAAAQVGAFSLVAGSKDAAILTTLSPGAYTMQVTDGGETGVALAEIYDASVNPNSEYQRLVNISSRGEAGAGENVLIGGFIITGNSPKRVLVRGIGPGLAAFGVSGTLADPRLRVYGTAGLIAENDNWSTSPTEAAANVQAATDTGAFALAAGSKDSAMILTLAPGSYTAQVGAADGTSVGTALVEIYELP